MNGEGSDIKPRLEGGLAVDQARREDKYERTSMWEDHRRRESGTLRGGQKPI